MFNERKTKMKNEIRINLIETLIKTLETYRLNTETPSKEQALTGALQDEISNLMTDQEFTDWIDTGEFKPEIKMIKHSFKTDRIYNFPQEITIIIERDKITFNDPSRNIAGIIDLDKNDLIVEAFNQGASHIDLIKRLAKTKTMKCYDNGKHKWLSSWEAAQLFDQ